jgi:DNA adenine methylase
MTAASIPKVSAVAPWYGSNRMLAEHVGRELRGCNWVGVPFAGGMSELPYIQARTLQVNDLHRHVVALARVVSDPVLKDELVRRVEALPFHPDVLKAAQARMSGLGFRPIQAAGLFGVAEPFETSELDCAVDYFVCAWMPRHGSGGTASEFRVGQSVRWNAGGGDSCAHYRGAVESIEAWHHVLKRANFTVMDAFDFLNRCKDEDGVGIYSDAPWPDAGDQYAHKFTDAQQFGLATVLSSFSRARVVVRFGDHPRIRELYPRPRWTWVELGGRTQTNAAARDVLIINGASYSAGGVE